MNLYVVKRLVLFIPTLLLVTIIVFALMRLIPGYPAYLRLIGSDGDAEFTQEQLEALQAQLGTDKPVVQQYVFWVWDMLRGDLNQYQGGMCISGRLTMTERTPRHLISPLGPNWVGTDSAV